MLTFKMVEAWADKLGYVVERVNRQYDGVRYYYEVYAKDNHAVVSICRTLWEVRSEVFNNNKMRKNNE